MSIEVLIEAGAKRVFASALAWPGWARSGRDEPSALENLAAYADRYRRALGAIRGPQGGFVVIERAQGNATTDFGAPGIPSASEDAPVNARELDRLIAVMRACWDRFDAIVSDSAGITLSTGPRGGGRALDAIVEHVVEAEGAYVAKLGAKVPRGAGPGPAREAFVAALGARARGEVADVGPRGGSRWSPRFAVRRAAWHVLDHAWEIEDRA